MLLGTRGAVAVYRASRDHLTTAITWATENDSAPEDGVFNPDDCLSLRSGYSYHFCKQQGDPGCRHFPLCGESEGLCIPMMDRGEVLGVLSLTPLEGSHLGEQTRQMAA